MSLQSDPWTVCSALGAIAAAIFTGALAIFAFLQRRDSRESSERQLRAYILIDSAEFIETPTGWQALLKIRNFGETPAYDVRTTLETEWRDRQDALVQLPLTGKRFVHPSTIMAPKHPVNIPVDIGGLPHDPAEWPIMANGERRPFIWGRVDYVDAFQCKRWTTFQLFSDLDGFKGLANCAFGNDAN